MKANELSKLERVFLGTMSVIAFLACAAAPMLIELFRSDLNAIAWVAVIPGTMAGFTYMWVRGYMDNVNE